MVIKMELYIGGTGQGKLTFVLSKYGEEKPFIIEEVSWISQINKKEPVIMNHFHEWFKKMLKEGEDPEKQIETVMQDYQELKLICDEIGNGIVPADPFEREYRERIGRCLCSIAQRADRVERILCGIGQRLK